MTNTDQYWSQRRQGPLTCSYREEGFGENKTSVCLLQTVRYYYGLDSRLTALYRQEASSPLQWLTLYSDVTEAHSGWIIEKWICRSHMFLCLTCAPLLAHLHHTQKDKTGGERSALWRQRCKQSHRTAMEKTQKNWEQVRATHTTNYLMKLWWEQAGKTTQTGSVKHNQKNERGAFKINRKQQTKPKASTSRLYFSFVLLLPWAYLN